METVEIRSRPIDRKPQLRSQLIAILVALITPPLLSFWLEGPALADSAWYGIGAALVLGALALISRYGGSPGWSLSANAEYLEVRLNNAQHWCSGLDVLADWRRGQDRVNGDYLRFTKQDGDLSSVPLASFRPEDVERLLDFLKTHVANAEVS